MNHHRIKILLVDNDDAYASMVTGMLSGSEHAQFDLVQAKRLEEATDILHQGSVDVMLLDVALSRNVSSVILSSALSATPSIESDLM